MPATQPDLFAPTVITARDPRWSMIRPTRIPASAQTSGAAEHAAVVTPAGHLVTWVICGFSTGDA